MRDLKIGQSTIITAKKLKALVVEDNDELRSINVEMLKMYGFDVISTESSAKALHMLHGIDLLVTDYNLLPNEPKGAVVAKKAKELGIKTVSYSGDRPREKVYDLVLQKPEGLKKVKELFAA